MNKRLQQFNLQLDQLLGIQPSALTLPGNSQERAALEAARLLHSLNFDAEITPKGSFTLKPFSQRRTFMQTLRAKPALMILFVFLALALLTGVAYAIGRSLGYIPGVGMVEQGSGIRVLAEPVSVTRDGITVSVQKAVLAAGRTIIIYQVDNLPTASHPILPTPVDSTSHEMPMPKVCDDWPVLRLPDGTRLDPVQSGDGRNWASGYNERLVYAPLPANLEDAVLILPCLSMTVPGSVPVDWEIKLHFVPAPADMPIYPVIDVPTLTPGPTISIAVSPSATQTGETQFAFPYGISLSLDKVIPMDNSTLLQASMKWTGDALLIASSPPDPQVRLLDTNGQELAFESIASEQPYAPDTHSYWMDFKVTGQPSGPVTLSVDSIPVELSTNATFVFDPGKNPKPGQTWQLDQDIEVQGRQIHLLSASAHSSGNTLNGYSFEMQSDSGVIFATVLDLEHPTVGGWGGGGGTGDSFEAGLSYAGRLPEGPLTITISSITIVLQGPWQTIWTPPASAVGGSTPTPLPVACLTSETWKQASSHPGLLPAGLSGKVGFDTWTQNGQTIPWNAAVSNVNDSNIRLLGEGSSAAFSPDGARVVFSTQSGFAITDLATGVQSLLPDTQNDIYPLWSPDGKEFAFMRVQTGIYDLFVMNVDGSNVRQVTQTPDSENLAAWTPDGNGLVFSINGPEGISVRILDLKTGSVKPLFTVHYDLASFAISPDGSQMAFTDLIYGNKMGLYVSALDGSNRRLLVNASPLDVSPPVWSPDGHWLAVSVWREDSVEHTIPIITLLQVDTCQVIPLPGLQGNITSWGP